MALFRDPFHDEFGSWPLAYIPYGGADYGEVAAVGRQVGNGDDGAFHAAWVAAAERLTEEAEAVLARGHRRSAAALLLRASSFYGASYHPLFGYPVDARLLASYRRQITLFDRGLALGDDPPEALRIPFDDTTLPGYLIPAADCARERRPLIIFTNGYDGTMTDLYFASVVAATRRGYHCLVFDGPGQGGALYEQDLRLRPDWESVIRAVVDEALRWEDRVDIKRIALAGWSLGGYLAPRAASGEHRLAACIADPGLISVAAGFSASAVRMGVPRDQAARLSAMEQPWIDRMEQGIAADRRLRWSVMQRGFWVHGTPSLREYLASVERFTLEGRIEEIRCPTLVTAAEGDALSFSAAALYEELRCPKQLLRFTAAEGGGSHCEMGNRSLLNQRVLDWLDEQVAA